ncbi:DNA-binding protein [Phenylobacterium sp.]|jgi:hypothetical protein|uniref:helix-turn-helix transcriptional regulator n=1 Tax=Phenylobacterium sp. TaxID=1871053 RepID=UPI002F3F3403
MAEASRPPDKYLRTPAAGAYLKLSGRTLEKHRTFGTGPRYRKVGGIVLYEIGDLDAWAERAAQTSTTDPNGGRVSAARPQAPATPHGP